MGRDLLSTSISSPASVPSSTESAVHAEGGVAGTSGRSVGNERHLAASVSGGRA